MIPSSPKISDSMEFMLSIRHVLSENKKKAFTYKKLLVSIPVPCQAYIFLYMSVY